MKFCNNCGQQMEDESVFCPNCGATNEVTATPAAKPADNAFMAKVQDIWAKVQNFCKNYVSAAQKDKKLIIMPVAAVLVVVALIVGACLLFAHPYKKAIKGYIAVEFGTATEKQYEASKPKEYWDLYEDDMDMDVDEMYENYEESSEEIVEYLEEEYGDDYKITFKIKEANKLSKKKLKDAKDYAKAFWDVSKKDVKVGYKVKAELTIKGDEDKDSDTIKAVVVKIDGKWYVVEAESPDFFS